MLGFTIRGGIQTSISVPVKGFFSKLGCELHWGVVQLGQDHGAPLATHSVLRLDATAKKRFDRKLFKFKKFSIK